jgi:chromate transporter
LLHPAAPPLEQTALAQPSVPLSHTLKTAALWLAIWIGPLHVASEIVIFFSRLSVVTFGGAYAALSYMAQRAIATYHWLSACEMLDGLDLAETTTPLVLVTEFVGFLAGFRKGGEPELASGLLGAAITLWVTFALCFSGFSSGRPISSA